jgi:hypothetical protein
MSSRLPEPGCARRTAEGGCLYMPRPRAARKNLDAPEIVFLLLIVLVIGGDGQGRAEGVR